MLEHKCEICGKLWRKKLIADGKVVCNKHYKQFKKFNMFKECSPRTQKDKNEIVIVDDKAYIKLYDVFYNDIAKAIIDVEDVDKVKYLKWSLNNNGYCVHKNKSALFLHRYILGINTTVDHINGNKLDNRKCNLRICDHSTNQMNNSKYKGYYYIADKNRWYAKIKINGKQLNIAWFSTKEEAQYCRLCAEKLLFKNFASKNKEEPQISTQRKEEINELVKRKVQRLQ